MRRFDDLEPDEMPEALRGAVRDREREQEREMERAAMQEAATEMGLTPEHLDRAAADAHARRVAEVRRGRRIRNAVIAGVVALLAAGAGYRALNPPAPEPTAYTFASASQGWVGEHNPLTVARLRAEGGRGVVEVERFVAEGDGRYWANLNTSAVPASLDGYREVSLRVRGDGGLPRVRLFLENGPTERWRSPDVPVGRDWSTVRFRLDQFEHQTRDHSGAPWRSRRGGTPDGVTGVSIKVGQPFNTPDARGRVEVDDLRIE